MEYISALTVKKTVVNPKFINQEQFRQNILTNKFGKTRKQKSFHSPIKMNKGGPAHSIYS